MNSTEFEDKYSEETCERLYQFSTTLYRALSIPDNTWMIMYADADEMLTKHFKQIRLSNDKKEKHVQLNK